MGHGQVPFSPFFLKATCFPTGPLIKNRVSKYPDGKMGKMEVSGGIRKTGYFRGLEYPTAAVSHRRDGGGCGQSCTCSSTRGCAYTHAPTLKKWGAGHGEHCHDTAPTPHTTSRVGRGVHSFSNGQEPPAFRQPAPRSMHRARTAQHNANAPTPSGMATSVHWWHFIFVPGIPRSSKAERPDHIVALSKSTINRSGTCVGLLKSDRM